MSEDIITYVFSFLFPFGLLMLIVQSILRRLGKTSEGWRPTVIIGILSALAVVVPVGGLPLARWVISLNPNFSIPLTAVVIHRVWKNASGTALLDQNAQTMGWMYGGIAGVVLYPMALGLGIFDPYSLGWGFSPLFIILPVLTVFLLVKRNRFGVVLVFCILGYHLHVLESPNLWDYFIDPFFAVVSIVALIRRFAKIKNRRDNRIAGVEK